MDVPCFRDFSQEKRLVFHLEIANQKKKKSRLYGVIKEVNCFSFRISYSFPAPPDGEETPVIEFKSLHC